MGGSVREEDDFTICGPKHMMLRTGPVIMLMEIDWGNEEHRRSMIACLLKSIYVLQNDQRRSVNDKLAPAWWQNFNFRLHRVLEFPCECLCCKCRQNILGANIRSFIYGAIFKYDAPPGRRHPLAPCYIIAFRGTMQNDPTVFSDMLLNLEVLTNGQLGKCRRFQLARNEVAKLLDSIDHGDGRAVAMAGTGMNPDPIVWLAGHSLGASLALDVGQHLMTSAGRNLPAFLFNPPHVSAAPVVQVLGMKEKDKKDMYTSSYKFKYVLGMTFWWSHMKRMEERFEQLSPWVPNIYVHQRDVICKGFIDYFEARRRLSKSSPEVAMVGTMLSFRDMIDAAFGKKSERAYLLPSARLWVNASTRGSAHALKQWWQQQGSDTLMLSSKVYDWS
ncbi:hypothetical protein U9M48_024899 [Paspalum notatum var. saurae]|uniref:Fungal lipase-like domain-containing protein n=1 Tax=Paspalum notatum var. saurae TaxID=547442 RepID=A0AAQ3TMU0_PASNO